MDSFFNFCLQFANKNIIFPLIVLGYIWISREFFYQACCVFFISILFSANLKLIFTYFFPITNKLFPSGHMLASAVLYGFILLGLKKIYFEAANNIISISKKIILSLLVMLILLILILIGAGLIYKNYHQLYEVLGGIFFAIILLKLFLLIKHKNLYIILMGVTLFLINFLLASEILAHIYLAIFGLFGICFSYLFFNKTLKANFLAKLMSCILFFGLFYSIRILFAFDWPKIIFQFQWFLIAASLPLSYWVTTQVHKYIISNYYRKN